MQIYKAILISLVLSISIGKAQAVEPHHEISPDWHMFVCAGFGYHLALDNSNETFRLIYSDECPSVLSTVYKGKFKIKKNTLVLDFVEFKAYYYIKNAYSPVCDNQSDSLTESELKLVCDKSQLDTAAEFLSADILPKKIFMKKTSLFPANIEGIVKGEMAETLARDLKEHLFTVD